jgi:hypothetical protein
MRRLVMTYMHRVNVKLGGINTIPDAKSAAILTDPANPTVVMGMRLSLYMAHSPDASYRCRCYAPGAR